MKKIKFFAVAAMLAVATSASAQFTNSKGSGSFSTADTDGWSTFNIEWNPSSLKPKHGDSESFTAFSLGFYRAFSVTPSAPLFVETGVGAQYSFASDFIVDDQSFYMLSAKVPLSLLYKFDIPNSNIALMPNAGLDFRFNILGKFKVDDESYNLFDKDEMGKTYVCKRFQIGWHVGLKARFGESFLLGVSYGTDFSELMKEIHVQTASVSLGFAF